MAGIQWDDIATLTQGPPESCQGLCQGPLEASAIRRRFCSACGCSISIVQEIQGVKRLELLAAGALDDSGMKPRFDPPLQDICGPGIARSFCDPRVSLVDLAAIAVTQGSTPQRLTGSCACGLCTFSLRGMLSELHHCHCGMCRRQSGAPFQTWTPVEMRELSWTTRATLVRLKTSGSAEREFCKSCGSALSITYFGQRGTTWLAAALLDESAAACCESFERRLHICVSSAPAWRRPENWFADGLKRISGICDNHANEDEDREDVHGLKEAFARSLADAGQPVSDADDDEDPELREALRLSMLDASPAAAGPASIDPGAVRTLVDATGQDEALVRAVLEACSGDADAAVMQLLASSDDSGASSSTSAQDVAEGPAPAEVQRFSKRLRTSDAPAPCIDLDD